MTRVDRRLLLTWAVLMGLTFLTGLAGVGGAERIGALWLAVLAVVTVVKARLILARYLRLEQAPGFLGGFTTSIVVVVAVVGFSFAEITKPLVSTTPGGGAKPAPTLVLPR